MTKFVFAWVPIGLLVVGSSQLNAQQCKGTVVHQTATCETTGKVVHVSTTTQTESKTIVDIAVGNPDFSTLVAAVKAAGLAETLSGKGPFTVFAPTNAAFAKLPKETLASLLKPENKGKLAAILTYHVVAGR